MTILDDLLSLNSQIMFKIKKVFRSTKRSSQEVSSAKQVCPMKYKEQAQLVNGNMKH